MMSILTKPSMIGMTVTGVMTIYLIYLYYMMMNSREPVTPYQQIVTLSMISLLIGIHSILHLEGEYHYDYNPLEAR